MGARSRAASLLPSYTTPRDTTTSGPCKPRTTVIDPFAAYLRERVKAYPGLTARRLFREIKDLGYSGGYTAPTEFLHDIRPPSEQGFEVRFETPPGEQAQVDFAQFHVVFTDEPTTPRIVWLFSMVLGYSRLIWARSVRSTATATMAFSSLPITRNNRLDQQAIRQ
ncbi:IS21 family insertion sequence transposase domain-containing protein (plasmid) [Sinorhizobium fredii]|uniref:IS21 family insertion sequence transposase domain-containing protein n=1 Tax=Rhizobium fredii TaxID=380 RepID=A0A2L0HBY8_RHIFR|nr:IS21 family insertion sequence transposase domain-containing protein [Sinorhizobium fredii]